MGDGWETKRSRQPSHKDWVVIKLYGTITHVFVALSNVDVYTSGTPTLLSHVVIDTIHFKGNFPQYCELHAINSTLDIPPHSKSHAPPPTCYPPSESRAPASSEDGWALVLPQVYLGPHREHSFQVDSAEKGVFTHVRLTIYPDGGVKRVRVFGRKDADSSVNIPLDRPEDTEAGNTAVKIPAPKVQQAARRTVPALPLTLEAFAPFGQVIQSYPDIHATPHGIKITPANFGTATKYHKLALLESSYPETAGATAGISVYRCQPAKVLYSDAGREVDVTALERHPYTNQAFLPMGEESRKKYLVVVAKNGEDDKPDISSLRAFVAAGNQGIVYKTAVWRECCSPALLKIFRES